MAENCVMERKNGPIERAVQPCRGTFRPTVDIIEQADSFILQADVPGVTAKDIDIEYEKGVLSVRARVSEREPKNARVLARGYGVGDFAREFRIGEGLDMEHVSAECANGVLTLRLPKAEAAKPRKIEVK